VPGQIESDGSVCVTAADTAAAFCRARRLEMKMTVEYNGYSALTGFLTKLTNEVDEKQYKVSTVQKYRSTRFGKEKYWESAVFKSGFFGAFGPLFVVVSMDHDENMIQEIHNDVKDFVEGCPPTEWPRGIISCSQFGNLTMLLSLAP
jgi:hypothetical protein